MDRKHKGLIIFSIISMVLLILIELGVLYFVLKPNDYVVNAPVDIVIEEVNNTTFKVSNQTFKRVFLPDKDNSSFLGYNLNQFETDLNYENSNLFMIDKQIYIKDNGCSYLLFFIDSGYFYVNVDIFDGGLVSPSRDDLAKSMRIFIDVLLDCNVVDDNALNIFLNDLQDLSRGVAIAIIPMLYESINAKPVIYLYPERETEVNVKVKNVKFTATYPKYENGWSIIAYPDGTLVDKNGRQYNYLYWEGLSLNFEDLSKGFVVEKENYISFLEEKLSVIGLTDKESCDFITYWLPQMNEYDYCLVSFQMENYEKVIKLDLSVKPDNELRVYAAFKGLDKMIDIEEQDLSYYSDFKREGFTVVEWGGTFINK